MTNKDNQYEQYELWFDPAWKDRQSKLLPLATWISEHDVDHSVESALYPLFPKELDTSTLLNYSSKTQSINSPEVFEELKQLGLSCNILEMGQVHWISTIPKDLKHKKGKKFQTLLVLHHDDVKDPYWAMRTLDFYSSYHQKAVEEGWIILYIVSNKPDYSGMYGNVLQEAFVLYPCDEDNVYLDISVARNLHVDIQNIPNYHYTPIGDKDVAPNEGLSWLGDVPLLDISRRWENLDSINRNLIMNYPMNKNDFNLEKVLHSATGKKMAEGFALEHTFPNATCNEYKMYWQRRGLRMGIHQTKGERWIVYYPSGVDTEKAEKLPVVVIMQEVNYANEHLPVKAASCFYEYHEIAANGDAILLYFALEDPESNDLLCEILDDASTIYPIDRERVYITGHSHNGFFSIIFARRHPDLIAAVATLGNPMGLMDPSVSGESVFAMSEKQVEQLRKFDIPVINIMGCFEWEGAELAQDWQRRLYASRCPAKSIEEIAVVKQSPDKAQRILGVPVDRTETLYMDGFEHYIGDVVNKKGRCHLRLVKIEGLPHVTTPCMQHLSWAFMRKFVRDSKTKAIVELC